jgi:hypothetical protein
VPSRCSTASSPLRCSTVAVRLMVLVLVSMLVSMLVSVSV